MAIASIQKTNSFIGDPLIDDSFPTIDKEIPWVFDGDSEFDIRLQGEKGDDDDVGVDEDADEFGDEDAEEFDDEEIEEIDEDVDEDEDYEDIDEDDDENDDFSAADDDP